MTTTTITITTNFKEGSSVVLTDTKTHLAEAVNKMKETIAIGETDYELFLAVDISSLKCFAITSDQDLTIETNSGSAADDTIALKANIPVVWQEGETAILTADIITNIFVTNASGVAANLQMVFCTDAPAT